MTPRAVRHSKRFRRDYAKAKRSGRDIEKLHAVMDMLIDGKTLPPKYRDHPLRGRWENLRDCHIEGDWLLLYENGETPEGMKLITFHATDTHENLFG